MQIGLQGRAADPGASARWRLGLAGVDLPEEVAVPVEEGAVHTTGVQFLAHEDTALKPYSQTRSRHLGGPPQRAFNQIGEALPTVIIDGMVAGSRSWDTRPCLSASGPASVVWAGGGVASGAWVPA